jgi:hypothetical protein
MDFEAWCEKVGDMSAEDKALALMAWNGCAEFYKSKVALLQHELLQTRHELMSCETALRDERLERLKEQK